MKPSTKGRWIVYLFRNIFFIVSFISMEIHEFDWFSYYFLFVTSNRTHSQFNSRKTDNNLTCSSCRFLFISRMPRKGAIQQLASFPLKELCHCSCILKKLAKLFKIVISNPFQSSSSSATLVPFCSRITPLVFFFHNKPLFLGLAIF